MGKDASEIRREIEETRARMGDTVEALGYKADVPARVKENISDRVETVRGTISDVVESVKDTVADAAGAVGGALGVGGARAGSALGGAKQSLAETFSGTTDTLGDATSNVTSSVTNTVRNTVGSVSGKVGSMTDKLPSAGDVTSAARRGVGIAVENPLGLALGALAVGFLAGLAAPVTDLERATVGPIRDDLVERAKSAGSDALEHGKQVLQETATAALGAAQTSAQQHGQQVISEAMGDADHGSSTNGSHDDTAGGSPARTASDTGKTSTRYGVLLDEDTLEPGKPGTASP